MWIKRKSGGGSAEESITEHRWRQEDKLEALLEGSKPSHTERGGEQEQLWVDNNHEGGGRQLGKVGRTELTALNGHQGLVKRDCTASDKLRAGEVGSVKQQKIHKDKGHWFVLSPLRSVRGRRYCETCTWSWERMTANARIKAGERKDLRIKRKGFVHILNEYSTASWERISLFWSWACCGKTTDLHSQAPAEELSGEKRRGAKLN